MRHSRYGQRTLRREELGSTTANQASCVAKDFLGKGGAWHWKAMATVRGRSDFPPAGGLSDADSRNVPDGLPAIIQALEEALAHLQEAVVRTEGVHRDEQERTSLIALRKAVAGTCAGTHCAARNTCAPGTGGVQQRPFLGDQFGLSSNLASGQELHIEGPVSSSDNSAVSV